ncbi:MAG: hypothetical protein AB7E81_01915 [Hyphomicrobiaceae bacterium]
MGLLTLGGDILLALGDTFTGRQRRRYEHWIDISSPPEIVWEMLKARDLVFEGPLSIRVIGEPVPGRNDLERVQILAGNARLVMLTRIVDERPGSAILYQLLPEGTDPALIEGDDDYIGFVLTELENGTRLNLTRETSPRGWLSRLTIPMGLRSGGRRYKRKAEAMLREALEHTPEPGTG